MARDKRKSGSLTVGAGLLVGLLTFLFHLPFAQNSFFFDDAADYIRASDGGFVPLWLNTNSASPVQLAHMRQADAGFRAHPWDSLYVAGDNAALRHFHVPLSFYGLRVVRLFSSSERDARLLISAVTALTCGWMVVFLTELAVPLLLSAFLGLLAGVQSRYIETSVDPSPHSWYMLFALSFLFYFALYLLRQRTVSLYLASVSLALAFATLEFSVELIASVPCALLAIALTQRQALPRWTDLRAPLLRSAGIFLATTAILWPGGWLRGGYLESYGVLSATVLFKNKSAFGEKLTGGVIYNSVFAHHPVLLVLALFCVAGNLVLLARRRLSTSTIVFVTYTVIAFGLGLADHFRLSTYVSEFLIFLIATSGLVYVDMFQAFAPSSLSFRKATLAGATLLLAAGCVSEWRQRNSAIAFRPWLQPILSSLRTNVPSGEVILVNEGWEAFALYLPQLRYEPTADKHTGTPRSTARNLQTRFALFESSVPAPSGSQLVGVFPSYPEHSVVLWRLRPSTPETTASQAAVVHAAR